MPKYVASLLLVLSALTTSLAAGPVNYDIVYVRAPRSGDNNYVRFPDVFFPTAMPSGSDLMLLHASGSEDVLFAAGKGAVLDPAVSFDAQWVYFSYIPDASSSGINPQRGLAYGGADIYKINIATRAVVRLTHQEWTPPTGSANWSTNLLSASPANSVYLGYGIFNLGSCPLPNGKLMFVSSRDGYLPNKGYTTPNLRLYIMDNDGRNVEPVGHLNIGSALHPTVLMDGRVMFASFEGQGVRDERNWGLWAIWPDGRLWEPLMSALSEASAFHFQTQLSDGRIAVTDYYNLNDNGFGTILAFNSQSQPGTIPFGSPNASDSSNPAVRWGLWDPGVPTAFQPRYTSFPFSPQGLINLTGFSHGEDRASSVAQDAGYAGKATHPAAAPGDDMLLVWSPGPCNNLNRPTTTPYYDAGIYLLKGGQAIDDYRNLVKIKNDPNYNELQPKALVTYSAIYGIAQPAALPYLPNDGSLSSLLPAGTPFGLIGTSSFYNRNTTPGFGSSLYNGLDSFNTSENGESSNWFEQGADDGNYTNADIYAVRILAMEGVAHRSYPFGSDIGFNNFSGTERLRILGEIPLRKTGALDPQGNPDTSFLAKVPADTPFSFQTLDKNGLVLNMAQTWHMLRPGEVRNNCGGCHAHNRQPVDFASTAAAQAGYQVTDLTTQTTLLTKDNAGNTTVKNAGRLVVDVEYYKDIKPILQRSCVQCHSQAGNAAAGLVLDDTALVKGFDNTYNRLANDSDAQWGIAPVISNHQWRQTNASRYIRMFQSRRSLLVWKVFGQRLDGWTNANHPTESTPGVASTLPQGADPNTADIDYTGTIMPPPSSGVPALTEDEKMNIARWIDLGAPITAQGAGSYKGYFADEIKPTLTVSSPRSGVNTGSLGVIRIGMFDAYSGIDASSLSVVTNFAVNGLAAGAELGSTFSQSAPSVWTLNLTAPVTNLANGAITVKVKDLAGNLTVVDRAFSVAASNQPSLSIAKTHVGNFVNGQNGTYTVTVSNTGGAAPTTGTVTVTETAPSGLTLTAMSGTGWTCNSNTCTRSDVLNGGSNYPVITVTVNVAANATSPQVNQVSVSGGGSATANASDSTAISTVQPTLSVNRKVLNFGLSGSLVTSPQTILVTIAGGTAWTVASDHSNITVNPGSGAGAGTFQISATSGPSGIVTVTAPGAIDSPQTITVNVASVTPASPFGSFDTPLNNTTGVIGAIPVTGWALDNIEVTKVDILREPVSGEPAGSLIFIGTAVFSADARPDVQGQFPTYPYQYRAGWGYQMLTNFLPQGNGTFKLHAIAYNKAGSQQDLGTKSITVDNAHAAKPFGGIDTPGQGGTISGTDSVNFGWALTPQPANIPIDGSTITVVIDGVPVGHPVYNQFRSDIANLFPGYANSGGAVGFFHINTTTLVNGVHTISWNAFDNLGRGEGLGSRYFNVLNTGGSIAAPEDVIPDTAVPDGGYSVTIEEVGRIELPLGAVSGNMLVQSEAHALPIGSTLKSGVFYWQPGPGFLGEYTMQFERPDGSRIPVRVSIVPKRW
jgi:uncharacterized repeat protein (TIGR01451 family)